MSQSASEKRPWLAALLAALATGLGHIYLQRWRRALGWLAVLFGVTTLFVDPAALDALANGNAVDPLAVAPTLVVGGMSVLDAYFLAHAQNALDRLTPTEDGELTHCPHCGKELDSDIEFCHWCTTELGERDGASPTRADDQ
ncbi:zinc ribbon domain-containing protein [Halostella pelagica]|uniref:zinc ribbon domain-containing protein n=1 Tax=Halostella pelagica TaxID=2583824 RepID=UPI00107FE0E3|nr:zinc ribbon domain-containing protein [Halostella pelagica]